MVMKTAIKVHTKSAMKEKSKKQGNSTISTAEALGAPVTEKIKSSLYTLDITVELVNVDKVVDAGVRVIVADGKSLSQGRPQDRHGLSTMSQRCVQTMSLPKPPAGTYG